MARITVRLIDDTLQVRCGEATLQYDVAESFVTEPTPQQRIDLGQALIVGGLRPEHFQGDTAETMVAEHMAELGFFGEDDDNNE